MSKVALEEAYVLKKILEPLIKYNPFLNIYYNPISNRVEKTIRYKYYNYMHQVIPYTNILFNKYVRLFIGDEVGLGKSVTAIRIMKYMLTTGLAKRILLIIPPCLMSQWVYHELSELLNSPESINIISRGNIDRLIKDVDLINNSGKPYIFIGSMDKLKYRSSDVNTGKVFKPYYDFIERVKWDLIIVDEAHKLGFTPGARRTLRVKRYMPILARTPHIILLSATPSRGYHEDFIKRISILIPGYRHENTPALIRNPGLRRSFYDSINEVFFYRRVKNYVNTLEGEKIFPNLHVYMGFVKLGEYKKLYDELSKFITDLLKTIDSKESVLTRIILLRRALSSPYSFLKTFMKVFTGPGEFVESSLLKRLERGIDPDFYSILYESKITDILEDILKAQPRVTEGLISRARSLFETFEKLYSEGDPGVKALYMLIDCMLNDCKLFETGKARGMIVFTEYSDTVDYVYNKIKEHYISRGFYFDIAKLKIHIYEALNQLCRLPYYFKPCRDDRAREKYVDKISKYNILLRSGDKYLLLSMLTSRNIEVLKILKYLVRVLEKRLGDKLVKILVSTDVASEGLNLEEYNIVVNYDVSWSPVKRDQRIGRVYRIRQTSDCYVVDLVYEHDLSICLYRKLVVKLLNMVEQRIEPYIAGSTLILKPYNVENVREIYGLTDFEVTRSVVDALTHSNGDLDRSLEYALSELNNLLTKMREAVEQLSQKTRRPDEVKLRFENIYGVSSHREALRIIVDLYTYIYGYTPSEDDLSSILIDIVNKLESISGSGDLSVLGYIDESVYSSGSLMTVDILDDSGRVRYSTPLLVLKRIDGGVEEYIGFKCLWKLVELLKCGKLVFKQVQPGREPPVDPTNRDIDKFVNDLKSNLSLFVKEDLERKLQRLRTIGAASDHIYEVITPRLKAKASWYTVIQPAPIQIVEAPPPGETELPEDVKLRMEILSSEIVLNMFLERGCSVKEVHIAEEYPYDFLFECFENGGVVEYMVEVKSHLDDVKYAYLTPAETEKAMHNPSNYIVCIVSNMKDKLVEFHSEWRIHCLEYDKLVKRFIAIVGIP